MGVAMNLGEERRMLAFEPLDMESEPAEEKIQPLATAPELTEIVEFLDPEWSALSRTPA
jgi:hypothetical protein